MVDAQKCAELPESGDAEVVYPRKAGSMSRTFSTVNRPSVSIVERRGASRARGAWRSAFRYHWGSDGEDGEMSNLRREHRGESRRAWAGRQMPRLRQRAEAQEQE